MTLPRPKAGPWTATPPGRGLEVASAAAAVAPHSAPLGPARGALRFSCSVWTQAARTVSSDGSSCSANSLCVTLGKLLNICLSFLVCKTGTQTFCSIARAPSEGVQDGARWSAREAPAAATTAPTLGFGSGRAGRLPAGGVWAPLSLRLLPCSRFTRTAGKHLSSHQASWTPSGIPGHCCGPCSPPKAPLPARSADFPPPLAPAPRWAALSLAFRLPAAGSAASAAPVFSGKNLCCDSTLPSLAPFGVQTVGDVRALVCSALLAWFLRVWGSRLGPLRAVCQALTWAFLVSGAAETRAHPHPLLTWCPPVPAERARWPWASAGSRPLTPPAGSQQCRASSGAYPHTWRKGGGGGQCLCGRGNRTATAFISNKAGGIGPAQGPTQRPSRLVPGLHLNARAACRKAECPDIIQPKYPGCD